MPRLLELCVNLLPWTGEHCGRSTVPVSVCLYRLRSCGMAHARRWRVIAPYMKDRSQLMVSVSPPRLASPLVVPRSTAQRWAVLVLRACQSEDDLKTLSAWSRFAGLSYSTLCESCRLVGVRPQAARDFMRSLRAVVRSTHEDCEPSVLLDISDRRILRTFVERAGPGFAQFQSIEHFVHQQLFIPPGHVGVRLVLKSFDLSGAGEQRL